MSQPMPFKEFRQLLQHCDAEHSPFEKVNPKHRRVVYITPHIDMRTGTVFAVRFRGFGWAALLHTQNECNDLPLTLHERCMRFLDGEEEGMHADVTNEKPTTAQDKLMASMLNQWSRDIVRVGREFDSTELKFTIPLDILEDALKEKGL